MTYHPAKTGTRVMVRTLNSGAWAYDEPGRVVRWTKVMGKRESLPAGYEPIRFDDGGCLMIHCEDFQIVKTPRKGKSTCSRISKSTTPTTQIFASSSRSPRA